MPPNSSCAANTLSTGDAMTLTAYVAQFLGVYLALSGVLMIVREQAMMVLVPKFVDSPPFLYFLGSLRVLIGLAIVLAHTMWIGTLGTVIYLVGWLTLLRGIAMLLLSHHRNRLEPPGTPLYRRRHVAHHLTFLCHHGRRRAHRSQARLSWPGFFLFDHTFGPVGVELGTRGATEEERHAKTSSVAARKRLANAAEHPQGGPLYRVWQSLRLRQVRGG